MNSSVMMKKEREREREIWQLMSQHDIEVTRMETNSTRE